MPRIHHRIGQILPSFNTTMETEIPALMRGREGLLPERFSFHSARIDALGYACLVAIMSMGRGYYRVSKARLCARTPENKGAAAVVTSAGALVEGLQALAAKKIALLASVQPVEYRRGLPVVSSSICTTWRMLKALNLQTRAPNAGSLLSGRY